MHINKCRCPKLVIFQHFQKIRSYVKVLYSFVVAFCAVWEVRLSHNFSACQNPDLPEPSAKGTVFSRACVFNIIVKYHVTIVVCTNIWICDSGFCNIDLYIHQFLCWYRLREPCRKEGRQSISRIEDVNASMPSGHNWLAQI